MAIKETPIGNEMRYFVKDKKLVFVMKLFFFISEKSDAVVSDMCKAQLELIGNVVFHLNLLFTSGTRVYKPIIHTESSLSLHRSYLPWQFRSHL